VIGIFGFAASTWAVLMGLAPLLQVRRMIRRRSSGDVSIGYLLILLPGFALWIGYGVVAGNLVLVIPNSVALAVAAATTGCAVALRERRSTPSSSRGAAR
jgi:MtN3 and saliva related transmembrane protein